MPRVFLSFLGTNRYIPVRYRLKDKVSELTPFVQEALVELLCSDWAKEDRLIFFITAEARKKSWEDGGNFPEGLATRLSRRGLQAAILPVEVSEGRSEEEIRNNFRTVIEQLSEGDEVFFDITHSFRSLPMLNLVALSYARVLKGVRIKGIYYGAFEALGSPKEVEKIPEDQRVAPVFDLTSYALLLEWSFAVDEFLRYGLAERLYELVRAEITPILKETRGRDIQAQVMRNTIEELRNLTLSIYTSRCPEIEGFQPQALAALVEDLRYPFGSLITRIQEKSRAFQTADPWEKALAAVEWCIEHGLIQQGYTILLESVITEVCRFLGAEAPYEDQKFRDFVSALLAKTADKTPPEKWHGILQKYRDIGVRIQREGGETFLGVAKAYDKLNKMRNDINHCGCKKERHKSIKLKDNLKECYLILKKAMNSLKKVNFSLRVELAP